MGRKAQKFRPNRVLADAIYSGLAALVRLALFRRNEETGQFYEQIHSIWENGHQIVSPNSNSSHGFSSIQNAEPALRELYLQTVWYSTRPYGNKEFKRVYEWREGTIGPLNALLNFAGAALRDILVPRYPFPDPDLYTVMETPDGQKRILAKSVADRVPLGAKVKTYLRAGYSGNSKSPRVILRHPTLPALDFGDMIRAHLVELCRQCFIHRVPQVEAHRYIRLLIHRLIPFMDWVYTQGEIGRKDFYPGADRVLRKIVLEIRTHYSTHLGAEEGISRQIDGISEDLGVDFLREQVRSLLESTDDDKVKERCATILDYIERGVITDIEVSRFIEDVVAKAQRDGTDWHRVLLSGFPHPRTLKEVVFGGDNLLQSSSGMQYLAEVPVIGVDGAGSIDLVLFIRTKSGKGQYIWLPVMILELKTKGDFGFNIYGKRPRTRKPDVYVPTLYTWKDPLIETEWNDTLASVPPRPHLDQLDAYEQALLIEYNALIGDALDVKRLWKGVVTLDTSQDYETTKLAFENLLEELSQRLLRSESHEQWKTLTFENNVKDQSVPRIAITTAPMQGPEHLLKGLTPVKETHHEDPFESRIEDDTFFTQYISVASPTPSGKSAAWLAKNWHLLNHLAELRDTTSGCSFLWIDLLGDYPSSRMIDLRFGLDRLRKDGLIKNEEYDRLSNFLMDIQFVDLREIADILMFSTRPSALDDLNSTIVYALSKENGRHIVVIDGWSDLEDMAPLKYRNNLEVVESSLLQVLKKHAYEVIWIDSGVNHPKISEIYQLSCLSPLYYKSQRRQVVDEILWNLPTAPRMIGWLSPQYDDSRVIIQDLPTEHPPWTSVIQVPILKGWTRKFDAASANNPTVETEEYVGSLNQQQDMYGRSFRGSSIQVRYDAISKDSLDEIKRKAPDLVPSLQRPRKESIKESEDEASTTDWNIIYKDVDSNRTQPSLTSRLHLDVSRPPPHPNRIGRRQTEIYVNAEQITRGWIHKENNSEDDEVVIITNKPPHIYASEPLLIDTIETKRREIRRLAYAASFLKVRTKIHDSLFSLYEEIITLCDYDPQQATDEKYLHDILVQVRDTLLRRNEAHRLWHLLSDTRESLGNLLHIEHQETLRSAKRLNVDLLDLYGMNLFLAVLSVSTRILQDVESPACIVLWSAVARWQIYQMGFRASDNEFEYRYDFRAIYRDLSRRAKQMKKTKISGTTRFPEQYGELLWQEKSEGGAVWLLFPSMRKTIIGALLEDQPSAYLHQRWYQCVMDPQQLKIMADAALSGADWEELKILLVDVNKQSVLFMQSDGEDEEAWVPVGALEYGNPPQDKRVRVRWIRLSAPLPETLLALQGYYPGSPPSDVRAQCDSVLKEAAGWTGLVREVSCLLTIDVDRQVYRINLLEQGKSIARKETQYTDEVIRFLRYPLRIGEYFSTKDGVYLKWNPLKDIEYDEVSIRNERGRREFYHLSVFSPFIHRTKFYADCFALPQTCKEFLQTRVGDDITLRIRVDKERRDRGYKKYLKVHLDGLKEGGKLSRLEYEDMGIYDVALLAECNQLIDTETNTRYSFSIDAESLVELQVAHILSDYPRLQSTIIGHIEELESAQPDVADMKNDEEVVIPEDAPELRLIKVEIEESTRKREIDINVQLCNIDDEADFEVLTLLSLSSEIAKVQSIAYEYIRDEIERNLRGYRVSADTTDEILREVEKALEESRVRIEYY